MILYLLIVVTNYNAEVIVHPAIFKNELMCYKVLDLARHKYSDAKFNFKGECVKYGKAL